MEEFNPMRVNLYSIEELIAFLENGYTIEDFKQSGLNYAKRQQLENMLDNKIWEQLRQNPGSTSQDYEAFISNYPNSPHVEEARNIIAQKKEDASTDNADWNIALSENTIDAYEYYLSKHPHGSHIEDAKAKIAYLIHIREQKVGTLLNDMKREPWKYKHDIMRKLFDGASERDIEDYRAGSSFQGLEIAVDFMVNHLTITIDDLMKNGVVPSGVTKADICAHDFQLPATTVKDMGTFPNDRTDIYFLGVPRSGKSSVLSGIIYHLWETGRAGYVPHLVGGIDPCGGYYNGLIQALGNKKPPTATPTDTISFMKLNIRNGNRTNDVTIVELSGEAFRKIADSMNGTDFKEVWAKLGATQCLQSSNRKCLFFVLDYSIISGKGGDERYNSASQSLVLESALRVLSYDGPNPNNPTKGCTMSKVESVAVIMTKSDLMENATTREQRISVAQNYIYRYFQNFMNDLYTVCKKYGINKAINYQPYILTFSLGNFYVGNTVLFDASDTSEIIKFISDITPSRDQSRFKIFG